MAVRSSYEGGDRLEALATKKETGYDAWLQWRMIVGFGYKGRDRLGGLAEGKETGCGTWLHGK